MRSKLSLKLGWPVKLRLYKLKDDHSMVIKIMYKLPSAMACQSWLLTCHEEWYTTVLYPLSYLREGPAKLNGPSKAERLNAKGVDSKSPAISPQTALTEKSTIKSPACFKVPSGVRLPISKPP